MGKLSQQILDFFLSKDRKILLVRNTDQFLLQPGRKMWLQANKIFVFEGKSLKFRIFYESEFKKSGFEYEKVVYVLESHEQVLEDIRQQAESLEFRIKDYLPEFSEAVTNSADLDLLDYLYNNRPLSNLNRKESIKFIIENYYEVDADHFGTIEATLVKWIKLYEKVSSPPHYIIEYLSELSRAHLSKTITKDRASLFEFIQNEWDNFLSTGTSEIDFTHKELSVLLNICFLHRSLVPSGMKINEPISKIIPFGFDKAGNNITKEQLTLPLIGELDVPEILWERAIVPISQVIRKSLKHHRYEEITNYIGKLNERFQAYIDKNYKENILPSSSIRSPKVVSRILDHISQNIEPDEKVALIVIDGMAFWQWLMLKDHLSEQGFNIDQNSTHSWLPSITQLSRQAIFRGNHPRPDYVQNPANESKLWQQYWVNKNIPAAQIMYQHDSYNFTTSGMESRLAFVDTALDHKMHSCSGYQDIYSLTENWIKTDNLLKLIERLNKSNFTIYLTTDHGNIQAKGWRNLKQYETFGANRSGSRSKRHLEYYVDKSLADNFLQQNPDLLEKVKRDVETLYLRDDSAFTNREYLVTHGGSHFLEVLIPFIKIW